MTLSMNNIQKMSQEFYDAFIDMFKDAQLRLENILRLKLRAIQKCKDSNHVIEYDNQFKDKFPNYTESKVLEKRPTKEFKG